MRKCKWFSPLQHIYFNHKIRLSIIYKVCTVKVNDSKEPTYNNSLFLFLCASFHLLVTNILDWCHKYVLFPLTECKHSSCFGHTYITFYSPGSKYINWVFCITCIRYFNEFPEDCTVFICILQFKKSFKKIV